VPDGTVAEDVMCMRIVDIWSGPDVKILSSNLGDSNPVQKQSAASIQVTCRGAAVITLAMARKSSGDEGLGTDFGDATHVNAFWSLY